MSKIHQTLIVQQNSCIKITFQLTLLDGTIVDEAIEGEALKFTLGDGTFLPKLEEMLMGLELGTTAKLTLSPERAFGLSNIENVHLMAREDFPVGMVLQEGFVVGFDTPAGEEVLGTILDINDTSIQVDFNHPLADKTIIFIATVQAILS